MKKLIIVMAMVLIMASTPVLAAMDFDDVKDTDWFYSNVQVLVDAGIISGYGDRKFGPTDNMNVDAFIKTMVVALGEDPGNASGYWAQNYIDKAMEMGILKDGDFTAYNKMITRAEMSKLAVRTVESLEGPKTYAYDNGSNDTLLNMVNDRSSIETAEAEGYVSQSYELGIITGYPDGSFKPNDGLKRSEACTVIRRVIDATQRNPFTVDDWSIRANEILADTGYAVFTDNRPIGDGGVITHEELRNNHEEFSFGSYLRFHGEDMPDGNWSILFMVKSAKLDEDNFKQQMYEVEYILDKVIELDRDIIDEILELLELRVATNGVIETKYWYPEEVDSVRALFTDELSPTLEISGIGFEF